jgi:hypothetical protein
MAGEHQTLLMVEAVIYSKVYHLDNPAVENVRGREATRGSSLKSQETPTVSNHIHVNSIPLEARASKT